MQTVVDRDQLRQLSYERYEDNRRHELATDIAERIGYPIDHTVEYEMIDGMAYATTDMKHRPFREQTAQALQEGKAKYSGVNEFEYVRLGLEHEEALMADAFGGGELGGNIMIKVSKVPDAVVDGTARIRGYRRDLLRSFVRIYYMSDGLMKCHLFSLDGNSSEGMAAVGEVIGMDMRAGRGSEDILADYQLDEFPGVDEQGVSELAQKIKSSYDAAILHATGERRHAGSWFLDQKDALSVVKSKPWLLDQHDEAVKDIMARALDEETASELIEQSLKRVAAAVTVLEDGGHVGSLSDASVDVAVQSGNYDRECATGESRTAGTPGEMGMNQAKPRKPFEDGQCRVCLRNSKVGECSVCQRCEDADNRGEDLAAIHAAALRQKVTQTAMAKNAVERSQLVAGSMPAMRPVSKTALLQQKYGKNIQISSLAAVGTAYTIISDERGQEIDRF